MLENAKHIIRLDCLRKNIEQQQTRVFKPLLHDTRYIIDIYRAISCKTPKEERLLFLFLTLLLYAPRKLLVGGRVRFGVIRELCRITKCSQPLLSHDMRLPLFYYQNYKSFRQTADDNLAIVCRLLNDYGITDETINAYLNKFR